MLIEQGRRVDWYDGSFIVVAWSLNHAPWDDAATPL
jgi:hypothetical protein